MTICLKNVIIFLARIFDKPNLLWKIGLFITNHDVSAVILEVEVDDKYIPMDDYDYQSGWSCSLINSS